MTKNEKRNLQWTIKELLEIVNGSNNVDEIYKESFSVKLDGKAISFQLLYNLLKKHKEYKLQRNTLHESCTREICENMHLLVVIVNSKLKIVDRKLPTNLNDLANEYSCNIESAECMNNICESCPKYYVNEDNFEEVV